MYDFYGGYGGMYPAGGMLVQTYPGGPLVAAVPVPMQPVPWNGSTGANGAGPGGEMAFYYALGYPAGDMSGALQLEAGGVNGSRRNSLESYQVRVSLFSRLAASIQCACRGIPPHQLYHKNTNERIRIF